jgi:predicted secreted protein
VLASNPVDELSADPHRVMVNTRFIVPPSQVPLAFVLTEVALATPDCAGLAAGENKGFRLHVEADGGQRRLVHADTAIPKSRGCPLRYAISDVVAFEREGQAATFVILISVFKTGFEGPDRRFIALPFLAR